MLEIFVCRACCVFTINVTFLTKPKVKNPRANKTSAANNLARIDELSLSVAVTVLYWAETEICLLQGNYPIKMKKNFKRRSPIYVSIVYIYPPPTIHLVTDSL